MEFDPVVMALIVGLVEWAKGLGVKGKQNQVLSMVVGLVLGIGQALSNGAPADFGGWFMVVVAALAHGLAASGLYDVGKRFARG